MELTQAQEKRIHPRVPFQAFVEYFTPEGLHHGEVVNLSIGGMLIKTKEPPIPDEPILVVFSLPSSPKILRIKSTVVWVSSIGDVGADHGMGIKFIEKGVEEQRILIQYIASTQLTKSAW